MSIADDTRDNCRNASHPALCLLGHWANHHGFLLAMIGVLTFWTAFGSLLYFLT